MSALHEPVLRWYDEHARELPWRGPDASAVVGDGLGVHAPADAGRPGAARARAVAGALADPGRPGRRADRRGGPRLGPARLPAPGAAAARRGDRDRRAARRRGAGVVRRPAGAARHRRLHRRRDRDLRLRPAPRRARHQRAPGLRPRGPGRGVPGRRRSRRPSARSRSSCCPTTSRPRPPGRSRSWSWARWCARPPTRAATDCPIGDACAWRAAGHPAYDGPPRKVQTWAGTDRQCRGRLLAVLRDSDGPVHRSRLDAVWTEESQRIRCLASLCADGLVVSSGPDTYALP